VLTLPEDAAVLTLQPPGRFVAVFKHLTDRDGQHFGFVVGVPSGDGFVVDATPCPAPVRRAPLAGVGRKARP